MLTSTSSLFAVVAVVLGISAVTAAETNPSISVVDDVLQINGADEGTAVAGNMFVNGELTVESTNGVVNVIAALDTCKQDYTALLERVVELEGIVSGINANLKSSTTTTSATSTTQSSTTTTTVTSTTVTSTTTTTVTTTTCSEGDFKVYENRLCYHNYVQKGALAKDKCKAACEEAECAEYSHHPLFGCRISKDSNGCGDETWQYDHDALKHSGAVGHYCTGVHAKKCTFGTRKIVCTRNKATEDIARPDQNKQHMKAQADCCYWFRPSHLADSDWMVLEFTKGKTGSFTVTTAGFARQIAVVAGGGGGGWSRYHVGGAGAGGVVVGNNVWMEKGTYEVTVGKGGPASVDYHQHSQSGAPSSIEHIDMLAEGGGAGACYGCASHLLTCYEGGSGGGPTEHAPKGCKSTQNVFPYSTRVHGYGSKGGDYNGDNGYKLMGGGGGAGEAGKDGGSNSGGWGGIGKDLSYWMGKKRSNDNPLGENGWFGGGGGGGAVPGGRAGIGGTGGGGYGSTGCATDGTPHTGGGGGGGERGCNAATSGGSGFVAVMFCAAPYNCPAP